MCVVVHSVGYIHGALFWRVGAGLWQGKSLGAPGRHEQSPATRHEERWRKYTSPPTTLPAIALRAGLRGAAPFHRHGRRAQRRRPRRSRSCYGTPRRRLGRRGVRHSSDALTLGAVQRFDRFRHVVLSHATASTCGCAYALRYSIESKVPLAGPLCLTGILSTVRRHLPDLSV